MLRLVVYFLVIAALAAVLSWLADNPGSIIVNWQGYIWNTDVFELAIILSVLSALTILLWTALRSIWQSPAAIGNFFNRRREKRGLEALSSGMIAIGAGDRSLATRYAIQARKSLPNEPMTHLLRAQAAQLAGDRSTSRRIFEAMLASPDTEALGLRGLFLEAEKEGEKEAARQFAERAVKLNPKLSWPVDALFDIQCRSSDWDGALETLAVARKHGHIEKPAADRRRAVLLAGQAQDAEDNDPERAMNLALEAHKLAPNLVPAAAVAGRLLASRGSTPRATKVLQQAWRKSPHPDLAVAYAYARLGDSPRDRLERVKQLAALTPNVSESPIAVANAAIEAREFDVARQALEPLTEGRLSQRVCTLMARIEGEQHNNAGAVREWLARAVNAPRDPAWTADGVVSDTWLPVSPVTGALDAFQWRVPVEANEPRDKELLAQKIEELVKLGVSPETMIGAGAPLSGQASDVSSAAPTDPSSEKEGLATTSEEAKPTSKAAPDREAVDVEAVEVKPGSGSDKSNEPAQTKENLVVRVEVATAEPLVASSDNTSVDIEQDAPREQPDAKKARVVIVEEKSSLSNEQAQSSSSTARSSDNPSNVTSDAPKQGSRGDKKVAASKGSGAETNIFVSPRAPDDPGPDAADSNLNAPTGRLPPFQTVKG
ncbi:MAG: heme biosynthesis protein HemY [Hyphomicrobiaceae bacterium TMED74]|nr:heme biosynthesis protein HemY [Filomicrobium sp.]RPG42351.1 MAG: heme biosynthesis protein HemY [Hyphomicrobiaceae bacterium TMED74]